QDLDARLMDLLAREARLDHDELARVVQPLEVIFQPEDRRAAVETLVGADPFEGTQPIVQRVRVDVHEGVVPVDELTFDPDLAHFVDHAALPQEKGYSSINLSSSPRQENQESACPAKLGRWGGERCHMTRCRTLAEPRSDLTPQHSDAARRMVAL